LLAVGSKDFRLFSFLSTRWFKLALTAGLLLALAYGVDVPRLAAQLSHVRPDVIGLVFAGYLAGQVLSASKWWLLARPLGFEQPLRTFVAYYFAGMYLNLFVPSMVAGDAARGYLLTRDRGGLAAALHSVVVDRVVGLAALTWLGAAAFLAFGPSVVPPALHYGMIGGAAATLLVWWGLPYGIAGTDRVSGRLRAWLERLDGPYRRLPGLLGVACGLSFVFHLFHLGLHVVIAEAMGLGVPWWYLALLVPAVQILSSLPVSFGGLGVRETGYVVSLGWWGVGSDAALAFGLVWSAVTLGANLCGGVAVYAALDRGLAWADLRKTSGASE